MTISIYTDGSSLGNPGPGGFCAIIKVGNREPPPRQDHRNAGQDRLATTASTGQAGNGERTVIVKGGDLHTTNNRMELSGIIAGLYYVKKNMPDEKVVQVFSDSQLVIHTMTKCWKRKKNLDLWAKLDRLSHDFTRISWHWVKGHSGQRENTHADEVAVAEAKKRKKLSKSS